MTSNDPPDTTLNASRAPPPSKTVLAWVHAEKGERRFELFVETTGHAETRETGWMPYRNLIRLAGDFEPSGVTTTITFTRSD